MKSLDEIPPVGTEAEEHAFWATHEFSDTLWEQAEPLEPDQLPKPRAETVPVVIRLDALTFKRVKALARVRRTSYQSPLQEFVADQLGLIKLAGMEIEDSLL